MWIKSYAETPQESADANARISLLINIFYGLNFFFNFFYGVLLDRVPTILLTLFTVFFGFLGYICIIFAEDDKSILVIFLIVLAGIAMPGFFNCGIYLSNKHYPHELRGTLSSIVNVFGLAGYLFVSILGGYLYDHFNKKSPFVLYDIMLVSSIFVIIYVRRVFKRRKEEQNA